MGGDGGRPRHRSRLHSRRSHSHRRRGRHHPDSAPHGHSRRRGRRTRRGLGALPAVPRRGSNHRDCERPREAGMSVDVSTEILIDRPVEATATYAADPSNAPEWYANIDSVEWKTDPPLRPGSKLAFRAKFPGRRLEYTYEIAELVPGERLVMRTHEGPFPMETSYTW